MARKPGKIFKPQVLTANVLTSGDVVYWQDGAWKDALTSAKVLQSAEEAEAALARAGDDVKNQRVLDPYLFEVDVSEGRIVPTSVREAIRAKGPTVRTDLGKQADFTRAA